MGFLEAINGVVGAVDSWLWSWPLIIVLVGTHLYMTIRTKFIQRKVITGIKLSFAKDKQAQGNISQFGALTTALSATIGTGIIVGVATAIVSGGVGAVFWMWIIGVLGIATKYAETLISVKYRVKDHKGDMLGGAMYALERGFKGKTWAKVVAVLFALFAALASFGIGGDHAVETVAPAGRCSGDAFVAVHACEFPFVVGLDVSGVVIALSFVAVQLIFVVSGNARVGGDLSPDPRLYWRCRVPADRRWNLRDCCHQVVSFLFL